jgi:hypothetical protein
MNNLYAYAAGIVDGEGSIMLSRNHAKEHRSPHVSVPSCTKQIVDFMKYMFGGHVSSKRVYKKGHSKSYVWSLNRGAAILFLEAILPMMQEPEKIRRARMLVNEYRTLTRRNGKYSKAQLILKREFEQRFFKYARKKQQTASSDGGSTPPTSTI